MIDEHRIIGQYGIPFVSCHPDSRLHKYGRILYTQVRLYGTLPDSRLHKCGRILYCTFARYETVEGEAGPGCELAEQ
eukprot:COSAG06_NODE_410_length_16089_cov_9.968793_1_plen_77_part_00